MNISESKKSIELYGEKGLYASIAYVMCEAEGKNPLFVNHTGVENRYEYLRIAKVAVDFLISSGLLSLDKPGDLDEAQDIWQKLQILGFSGDDRKRFMSLIVNHATVFGPSGLDDLEAWVKESMRGTIPSEEVVTPSRIATDLRKRAAELLKFLEENRYDAFAANSHLSIAQSYMQVALLLETEGVRHS